MRRRKQLTASRKRLNDKKRQLREGLPKRRRRMRYPWMGEPKATKSKRLKRQNERSEARMRRMT